jgi:hypothetical protein
MLPVTVKGKMDYTPLLRRALRASFAVRSGILPPQSRFRGNDGNGMFVGLLRQLEHARRIASGRPTGLPLLPSIQTMTVCPSA